MRISAKCRYGIAAMITLGENPRQDEYITIISIAEKLGISKIYLEQVFSLLKRADLVISIKGAHGGYKLAVSSKEITAGQIMRAIEAGLFEKTESSVSEEASYIDDAMEKILWDSLDEAVSKNIDAITLENLVNDAVKRRENKNYIFYI